MEHMQDLVRLIKYVFLGAFQGFTEPIPISSSGHLILLRSFLNIDLQGLSFEIFVHFGSLIAIMIMYRKDIVRLCKNGLAFAITKNRKGKDEFHFILLLVTATIPTALIGLLLQDYISHSLSTTFVAASTLIITGISLWIIRNLRGKKEDRDLSFKDALLIGIAQTIALIPGISRSGATIVAAMLLGTKQETALRFSFLLFIPVSFGAMILSIRDIITDPHIHSLFIPYFVSFMVAIIATLFSLRWFMHIMEKGNLKYFSYYCFAVGLLVILFFT